MGIMADWLGWHYPKDWPHTRAGLRYYREMQHIKSVVLLLVVLLFGAGALAAQHHVQPAKHASRHTVAKRKAARRKASHKSGSWHRPAHRAHPKAN
jgi:hypothetical protein